MRRLTKLELEQIGDDLCLVFTADCQKGRGIVGAVDLPTVRLIAAELAAAVERFQQTRISA